jgi:hypothetical protein
MSLAALGASWLAPVATRSTGTYAVAGDTLPLVDRRHSAISLLSLAQTIVGPLDVDPFRWGLTANSRVYIERAAVFDRFHRTPDARAIPGSGLGLAIVASAVAEERGTVTLGDAPEGGLLVRVSLPR